MENNNYKSEKEYLINKYTEIFKLKNNDFFGLLDIKFYLKEFLFFPRLLAFLASRQNLDDNKAQNLGIVSTLVYLSAKIHFSVHDDKNEHFASSMQFPILLGDLLYGKVIECLMSSPYSACLADYLNYLQGLNAAVIDYLNGNIDKSALDEWRFSKLALLSAALLGVEDEQELALTVDLAQKFAALDEEKYSLISAQDEIAKSFAFLQEDLKIASLAELCQNID